MRVKLLFLFVVLGCASLPALAEGTDLTGVWECNDGGKYYLRQIDNAIWWFGESSPAEPAWANVAHGEIVKGEIKLKWTDVPKGGAEAHGTLVVRVVSNSRLELKTETGGFGGTAWTRAGAQ